MIYPQHVLVALTGLGLASAAPAVHNAKKTHTLVAPGDAKPLGLVQKIKETDYTPSCYTAWELFDHSRCWCFTGCALDCSQGGHPGTPGKDLHPQWCENLTDEDHASCEALTCDLVENCKDVDDDLKPGLDKIESTGSYDSCPKAEPMEGIDHHTDMWLCGNVGPFYGQDPKPDLSKNYEVLYKGETYFVGKPFHDVRYTHNGQPGDYVVWDWGGNGRNTDAAPPGLGIDDLGCSFFPEVSSDISIRVVS
jgi:hypothetical protein